jgi:hypothetical protein
MFVLTFLGSLLSAEERMSRKQHFVPREHFVNKLRDLGFKFVREASKVELWRQRGSGNLISVPRRDLIPETHVICSLHQCGCGKSEIEAFVAAVKS